MNIITLYKTIRPNGGITVSPNAPEDGVEYTESVRLVADEGEVLTQDGITLYSCIDTDSSEGWYEVYEQNDTISSEIAEKAQAYDILMGNEVSE